MIKDKPRIDFRETQCRLVTSCLVHHSLPHALGPSMGRSQQEEMQSIAQNVRWQVIGTREESHDFHPYIFSTGLAMIREPLEGESSCVETHCCPTSQQPIMRRALTFFVSSTDNQ
mmetsp:Transcript_27747/g.84699  ORF Transcript_27747/g.84699 Transcript_27747/m.84699 type:complete len:115 (-) Transcript_27747:1153-1497(-)